MEFRRVLFRSEPKGNIRHKASIHHIHMEPVGSAFINHFHVFIQMGKISRQYRRGNEVFHWIYKQVLVRIVNDNQNTVKKYNNIMRRYICMSLLFRSEARSVGKECVSK